MTFGQKIRQLRNNTGHSQEALASMLEITQSHLSHLEQGRRLPSAHLLHKLGEVLELDEADLSELRMLAVVASDREGRQPPQLRPEPVEEERNRQRDATEVWVIARSPLESYDGAYRKLVIDGITSQENPRKYIYWTSSPKSFDAMLGKLSLELGQRLKEENDDRDPQSILAEMITCIITPEPATWFSFVIYDPTKPYVRPSAFLSIEESGAHTGFVTDMPGSAPLERALDDLKDALSTLTTLSLDSTSLRARGWALHFPNNLGGVR